MTKPREAIGEIDCPLCKRSAELHASEDRPKLDPDGEGGGKSYPRKYFVRCPPVRGYSGCGTIMANGSGAQIRLMELGTIYGVVRPARAEPPPPAPRAEPPPAPAAAAPPPAAPVKPAEKKNPFAMW